MTTLEHLSCLAEGRRPEDDGLLGSARYQWNDVEYIGEEEILANFRQRPFELDGVEMKLSSACSAALIAEDRALFADIHEDRITRLWRVGGSILAYEPLPRVGVAFDNDLRQSRREWLGFRLEDHLDLTRALSQPLLDLGEGVLSNFYDEALRTRGFVIRAFSDQDSVAALLSIFTLGTDPERRPVSRFAVVALSETSQSFTIVSPTADRDWSPRL